MKNALLIATIATFLVSTPVLAVSSHANEHAKVNQENKTISVQNQTTAETSVTPFVSPTDTQEDTNKNMSPTTTVTPTCDPSANWKNHGAYVSCVAHEHLGGQVVSAAARSNVGKKHDNGNLTPTSSISETPTATPSPTGEPVTSPLSTVQTGFSPLESLGDMVNRFFGFVSHLI